MWGNCPLCERTGVSIFSRGFCGPCDQAFNTAMQALYNRFDKYLARHAQFDEWLAEHGKE